MKDNFAFVNAPVKQQDYNFPEMDKPDSIAFAKSEIKDSEKDVYVDKLTKLTGKKTWKEHIKRLQPSNQEVRVYEFTPDTIMVYNATKGTVDAVVYKGKQYIPANKFLTQVKDTMNKTVEEVKEPYIVVSENNYNRYGGGTFVEGVWSDPERARKFAEKLNGRYKQNFIVIKKTSGNYAVMDESSAVGSNCKPVSLEEFTEENFGTDHINDEYEVNRNMGLSDLEVIVHDTINYINKKYPNENNTMDRWITLIGEEFGELCRGINDGEVNNVIEEGTQTIAAIYLMMLDFIKAQGV